MASVESCIYCGAAFDPNRGEGDHTIPSQLGEFRNDIRFRRVCPCCNSKIGRAEQQMVQSGPEGFFRQIIKPRSKRLNKRGIGSARGALGSPPPQYMVNMGDHLALVSPSLDNPQDVNPVDHILVRDAAGKEKHVRLFPGIRVDQVRKALANAGLGEMKDARLHCAEDCWAEYTNLLKAVWPKSKLEEGEPTPAGVHSDVLGTIKFVVNANYFRAIAKIAFHYFLTHTHRGFRGSEPCFADVRQFIVHGGDSSRFFKETTRPTFVLPFGELSGGGAVTPSKWCHILAACEAGGQAVAYAQLFVGPGCVPSPHYVWLGRWDGHIISLNSTWGNVYIYDDPQGDGRYAGRVRALQISSLRP